MKYSTSQGSPNLHFSKPEFDYLLLKSYFEMLDLPKEILHFVDTESLDRCRETHQNCILVKRTRMDIMQKSVTFSLTLEFEYTNLKTVQI